MDSLDRLNGDIDKLFETGDFKMLDDYLNKTTLKDSIAQKLLDYQIVHVSKLLGCMGINNTIFDGSDTGTGKTYSAIALCAQLNKKPLVVCPKPVISTWLRVIEYFNIDYYGVVNYESFRNCKYYKKKDIKELKNSDCPFISQDKNNKYKWKVNNDCIIIFDEAHRCKNKKTHNGNLLLSLKNSELSKIKKLILSATIADTIENFACFGYVLGFYDKMTKSKAWVQNILKKSKNTGVKCIYDEIYPKYGSRMLIHEISNFPKTSVISETYTSNKYIKLNKYRKNILELENNNNKDKLIKITELLQKMELIKIPIFIDLAKDMLANGFHIVVFFNYLSSIDKFIEDINLDEKYIKSIKGETTQQNRDKIVDKFRKDKLKIVVVSKKLQEGISFHDIRGKHPRGSLISPNYSSQDLIQTLGRVNRAGSKTRSIQKIVFIANSFEESIAEKLSKKIKFNENINGIDFKINL
uniref:Helicase ATP-binding domain-containing protein n=1 Tax=viral metagenome TaxID=1070528 RepID=A0A6C0ACI7_9ZZZZ